MWDLPRSTGQVLRVGPSPLCRSGSATASVCPCTAHSRVSVPPFGPFRRALQETGSRQNYAKLTYLLKRLILAKICPSWSLTSYFLMPGIAGASWIMPTSWRRTRRTLTTRRKLGPGALTRTRRARRRRWPRPRSRGTFSAQAFNTEWSGIIVFFPRQLYSLPDRRRKKC